MIMRRAVLGAPSRSTTVCNGNVRWFFPAAVMTAFLISIKAQQASQELAKPSNFYARDEAQARKGMVLATDETRIRRGRCVNLARMWPRLLVISNLEI